MNDGPTQTTRSAQRSLLLALALLGCDDGPLPIQYETEHLRIGTNSFLCQGDLDELEDHIAFVEDDLGLEMDRVIDVYVWDVETWLEHDFECTGAETKAYGCYSYDDLAIYSSNVTLKHELAHAVVNNSALGRFFGEGIAEGYDVEVARYGDSTPSTNIGLTDVDRRTASHFVRWLLSKWGGQRLGDLARHEETQFEAVYGLSLAEAEAMYLAEVSSIYPPVRDCYYPEFSTTDSPTVLSTDVQLDCASGDTRKGGGSLYTQRTLVIPTDGRYSLATDASLVSMYRCEDTPGTIDDQHEPSDVPSIYQSKVYRNWRHFVGLEVHTVELRRGRYHVSIRIDGYEPGSAKVQVWPAIGPGPVGG